MELTEQTRRLFYFDCDKNWCFDFGDVKANNGTIQFQRPAIHETHRFEFGSVESCKLWALRYGAAMMEGFVANKRVDKKLYDVKSSALAIDDSEWEKVAKYMTNPDRFDRDNDIKIFESHLANNFRDRDGERFPKAILKSFEKSIVGKGKLMGHKWGDPGNGRFYSATVKKMSVDETLEFVGAQPDKNFRKHLEFIEERDGGIFWLVTRYYMPNITEMQKEAIIYIESGIWKDMSIGFRAPLKFAIFEDGKEALLKPGPFGGMDVEEDDDNSILFLEFRNDKDLEAEALEGSHVFLGSQIGAQTSKSVDDLEIQIKALNGKLDKVMGKIGRKKKASGQSSVGSPQSAVGSQQSATKTADVPSAGDGDKEVVGEQLVADSENDWIGVDAIADEDIKKLVIALDEAIAKEDEDFAKLSDAEKSAALKAVWTAAYINTFEDNCFALVEDTGDKDDNGQIVPKNARHLPHHDKGNGATGAGGTVDLPHLRNALARVNQVNPVTETMTAEALQAKAREHLVAHAKKLEIGDYDMEDESPKENSEKVEEAKCDNTNPINEVSVMKEFNFELFGAKQTVNDEKFDETMKALNTVLLEKETAFNQQLADLTQKVSDFEDKAAVSEEAVKTLTEQNTKLEGFAKSVKEVFGEDVTIEAMKRAKETEIAHRDSEIKRSIKFGGLIGIVKDVQKELQRYEKYETDQITAFADKYQEDFEARYPEFAGVLKGNSEEVLTKPDPEPEKVVEIEAPRQHYRW